MDEHHRDDSQEHGARRWRLVHSPYPLSYIISILLCVVFWQDDKIKQAAPALLAQVPLCIHLESRSLLQDTLSALVENASDDILLKKINLDLLMHTRSEDVQVRLFALGCARGLWEAHGGKLLGMFFLLFLLILLLLVVLWMGSFLFSRLGNFPSLDWRNFLLLLLGETFGELTGFYRIRG